MAGGNSARNIRDGLEGSLRRLGTDHIDMYRTHVWDRTTPVEEVLRALTDAVRRGGILYYGFSNAPAWYAAQIATLGRVHGLPEPVGLQYSYSLIDRGVELDLVPAGRALGLGLVAWSPLGFGMLTGKYGREKLAAFGPAGGVPNKSGEHTGGSDCRLDGDNPYGGMLFTEANFGIVDELRAVAYADDQRNDDRWRQELVRQLERPSGSPLRSLSTITRNRAGDAVARTGRADVSASNVMPPESAARRERRCCIAFPRHRMSGAFMASPAVHGGHLDGAEDVLRGTRRQRAVDGLKRTKS